jgi:hypothetical protein
MLICVEIFVMYLILGDSRYAGMPVTVQVKRMTQFKEPE